MRDDTVDDLFRTAWTRLAEEADPDRAREAKRFFPGGTRVLGTPSGWARELGRDLSNALRDQGAAPEDTLWVAEQLFQTQTMEAGTVANEVLGRWWRHFGNEHWARFGRWMEWFDNWGTTDSFCLKVAGHLVMREGAPATVLRDWAQSPNIWQRRAALVSLIPAARKGGERELLLELCARLLQDAEPYVQKAIGWSLKELYKGDSEAVIDFLQAHGDVMQASTVRYACERMTEAERALARGSA